MLRAAYRPGEFLRDKDFSKVSETEPSDIRHFLRAIRWQPPQRRSRRRRAHPSGDEIDVRRVLRHSLRNSGEMLDLPKRKQRVKPRSLILLCDVSGSMDTYSRVFLQFLHTMHATLGTAETFVFGTRLTRITHLTRRKNVNAALAAVHGHVLDWSGGTRIGEAIGTFNRVWAKRVASHGAVIMVISDGWERGDPDRLAKEMARLQRVSHRVVWLNPLLGSRAYEPLTQGMQAALPYVDDFLPAHNLASLEALAHLLNGTEVRERSYR